MRQIKEVAVFSVLTVFVLLSCKKPDTSPATPPAGTPKERTVKAKVIEYGSDLPIAGATLNICTTAVRTGNGYKCAGNYSSFITDSNGECLFRTDSVYQLGWALKDWYYSRFSNCLLENDGAMQDSFTVRLVPYTYVTVHVKDTNTIIKGPRLLLLSRGLLYPRIGDGGECYSDLSYPVELRPQLDTTLFRYLVYGNVDNEFIISKGVIPWEGLPVGVIRQEIKYIPKTGDVTVEILY